MPFSCPHCSEAIENAVEKKTMEERIGAKNTEISTLKDALRTVKTEAEELPSIREQLEKANGRIRGMERKVALTGIGVTDERVSKAMEAVYESEMAGRNDDERVAFDDFSWAKDHPLFEQYFTGDDGGKKGPETPPGKGPDTKPPPKNKVPHTPGDPPPPRQGKMTDQQLRAYFNSDEYKALPPEDRKKKIDELRAQVRGDGQNAAA